jgi:hypothetical protein
VTRPDVQQVIRSESSMSSNAVATRSDVRQEIIPVAHNAVSKKTTEEKTPQPKVVPDSKPAVTVRTSGGTSSKMDRDEFGSIFASRSRFAIRTSPCDPAIP